ncbi:MAG TPA: hypothetical protein DCO80_07480, partial [Ornithinibacillus sp.]|nr:hypothetical protein [Ornithinibacillus sp.]
MKKESILMFVVTLITLVAFNASSSIVNADSIEYANTSKLGHMKSSEVKIYRELADSSTSFNTGETYLNEVFYIKKQAKINNELYYLISKEPSSQNGVIGWVKSTDIESRDHVTIDKSEKILYITGTGTAYNKAWGGSKNSVYGSLFPYKSREFKIHLTERVGNETWYRGILDGKTVFISESNLSMKEENATSKLGHLKSSGVKIYKQLVEPSTSFNAGETYLNEVFYIKKQATINDELYYLISKEPSSVNGVIGWVKSSDVESRDHSTIDRLDKVLYITGTGLAYNKAWGGSKNTVFSNLSTYKLREFKVHLTERVGNEIWYRGYLDGKAVFIKSDFLSFGKETTISKLGHIRNSMVKIFQSLGPEQEYIEAGETYTNAVYYIKKQSEVNGQIFYLISKEPSSTNGVVGWVNSKDLTTYDHVTISKESKSFYVKGTGSAYSKAWGGSKDAVYPNLSIYKSQEFKVILTEKVGNNTWYRGILDGNTVFIHESYLTTKEESATSKLGHLKGSEVKIYKELVDTSTAFNAGSTYLNEVFYIKKQAAIYDELYYLISREPSSVNGVIGWVKSTDINSQDHVTIDKLDKTLHFTGTGSAYNKAWGGSENTVYEDLSPYRSQQFKIHLTELVGNEIWYRGFLNGEAIFIHEDYLTTKEESATSKLGKLKSSEVKIYKELVDPTTAFKADETLLSEVFYIKKQATINDEGYYLISREPSSVNGVIGWVKSTDIDSRDHVTIDKSDKILYIKGTGVAYDKAWGGSKNIVYGNLSSYKSREFKIHLTERIGNETWYRGLLDGEYVFIHEDYLTTKEESATS